MQVQANNVHGRFVVTGDGTGVVGRVGVGLVASFADRIGLTAALSEAAGPAVAWRRHDPGVVLRNVALMLADGGTALTHVGVLDGQRTLFGQVASPATTCRTLAAVADDAGAMAAIADARRQMRQRVWDAGGTPPVVRAAANGEDPAEPLMLDIDATIVTAGSDDKHGASSTFKGTFGFHPIMAYLDRGDGTGEALVGMLRSGRRPAHVAADNIAVLDAALDQLPDLPDDLELVVRGDQALATHRFIDHAVACDVGFSVSYPVIDAIKEAIRELDDDAWRSALRQDGTVRDGAGVVELTGQVELNRWPDRTRLIVRREPLHPGAQQTIDDIDGFRFTALITDQPGNATDLECRHRARARVEDRIREAKDLGLRKLPLETFDRNHLWVQLVLAAHDLITFTKLVCLDGDLQLAEPVTLRHRLLHVPARVVRHARRTYTRIAQHWPWTDQLVNAFARLDRLLPAPT